MRKLFTFGDSFTFNKKYEECEYSIKYRKNGELIWPDIISKKIGFELYNFGYGSLSNDRIMDNIIEKINLITENDIVIVGKTFYDRFDIPNNENNIKPGLVYKFTTITPGSFDLLVKLGFTKQEANSIIYYGHQYDNDIFIKRTNLRFDFIKKFLENNKIYNCFFWDVEYNWGKYENIKQSTNNEIFDLHWSYKGHRDFANKLINDFNLKSI